MIETTLPHKKIELDADQQLALVNVYRLLIELAENAVGENLRSGGAVGNEIRMKDLTLGQTDLFHEEVFS